MASTRSRVGASRVGFDAGKGFEVGAGFDAAAGGRGANTPVAACLSGDCCGTAACAALALLGMAAGFAGMRVADASRAVGAFAALRGAGRVAAVFFATGRGDVLLDNVLLDEAAFDAVFFLLATWVVTLRAVADLVAALAPAVFFATVGRRVAAFFVGAVFPGAVFFVTAFFVTVFLAAVFFAAGFFVAAVLRAAALFAADRFTLLDLAVADFVLFVFFAAGFFFAAAVRAVLRVVAMVGLRLCDGASRGSDYD